MVDWISGARAAEIIGISRSEVYRSLVNPSERAEWWGEENIGWRHKPVSSRRIFQVSRQRAEELAAGAGERPDPEPE